MSTTTDQAPPPDDAAALRADIAQTREELAQTAQALGDKVGEKLDVKQQARNAAGSVQARAREVPAQASSLWASDPVPVVAGVVTSLVTLLVLTWKDRR